MMDTGLPALLAAIREQRWAILPAYLDAIEAIAVRAWDAPTLEALRGDGHKERLAAERAAMAATGTPLAGTYAAVVANGVAAIPVFGPIYPRANMIQASAGGVSLAQMVSDFRVADASPDVSRIVMVWDSPGGAVSGLGEAADVIRSASKPVTSFVTGVAASAGYWLASQASEIVMDRSAAVGSIGVMASVSRQEAPGSDGKWTHQVVSSNAPRKRPDPTTDEGRAALQEEVDALEAVFIADVARGRNVSEARVRADFGRGGMLPARAAIEAGMADRLGTLEQVMRNPGRTPAGKGPGRARAAAEIETRRRAADRS